MREWIVNCCPLVQLLAYVIIPEENKLEMEKPLLWQTK